MKLSKRWNANLWSFNMLSFWINSHSHNLIKILVWKLIHLNYLALHLNEKIYYTFLWYNIEFLNQTIVLWWKILCIGQFVISDSNCEKHQRLNILGIFMITFSVQFYLVPLLFVIQFILLNFFAWMEKWKDKYGQVTPTSWHAMFYYPFGILTIIKLKAFSSSLSIV